MLKLNKILRLAAIFLALFIQVSAQNPTAKDFFDEGLGFLKAQKFTEALEAFRKNAQLDPKRPATQANISTTLVKLNRVSDSIVPFREAVKLAPDEPRFHTALCHSLSLSEKAALSKRRCFFIALRFVKLRFTSF